MRARNGARGGTGAAPWRAPARARVAELRAGPIGCEELLAPPTHRIAPHAHETAHACFVLEGALAERDGSGERVLRAGDARASPPGDAHRLWVGAEGLRCLILHVDDAAIADSGLAAPGERRFLSGPRASGLGRRLADEVRRGDDASPVALEMLALEMLATLERTPSERPGPPPPWLLRLRDRLRGDLRTAPTLAELAAEAGVSRAHVARAFRGQFGCTVGEYLRALRVERARRLLRDTDLELGRVAFRAGYADQSHMTRSVRDRLGLTPGRYRAAARGDATLVQYVRTSVPPSSGT